MNKNNAIELKHIQFQKNQQEILKDVSFSIKEGEIFGLIGHNGAGKTSLLRILSGLTVTYKGELKFFEDSNLSMQRAKLGIVMDEFGMDENLSALAYLRRISAMFEQKNKRSERELLDLVGLQNVGRKKIKFYSLGMKRRLAIAASLIGNPKILILDEPFNGIDPNGMTEIRLLLQNLLQQGLTILVTSHVIPELLKLATTYGIMYQGSYQGSYTGDDLQKINLKKTVFQVGQTVSESLPNLNKKYPHMYFVSESLGEMTIYGEISQDFMEQQKATGTVWKEITCTRASEEEKLLWKMNGFTE